MKSQYEESISESFSEYDGPYNNRKCTFQLECRVEEWKNLSVWAQDAQKRLEINICRSTNVNTKEQKDVQRLEIYLIRKWEDYITKQNPRTDAN